MLDRECGVGGAFMDVDADIGCRIDADKWSELAGEAPCWEPYDVVAAGEAECEDGVGRLFGEVADECPWSGGGNGDTMPGSSFGAILEFDLRAWCLLRMAR